MVFAFSVLLIALGVMTLNSILAVMNGNQQGFIHSIMEIGSFHIRWYSDDDSLSIDNFLERLNREDGVKIALPFREGQTLLTGTRPSPSGALLRGLPEDVYSRDDGMASRLDIIAGVFDLSASSIVLGAQLAFQLGLRPGDMVKVMNFSGNSSLSEDLELPVSAVFKCDYREYESSLAFVSLDTAARIFGDVPLEIGIKLERPHSDQVFMQNFHHPSSPIPGTFVSWRESNRAFFGALRTEKAIMLLLLALIFVVVAVNIDHSLRRMATERIEDLAILKALGASPRDVRILFLRHGLIIGGFGGFAGSVLGVLIGQNISIILRIFGVLRAYLFPFRDVTIRSRAMEAFLTNSQVMVQDVIIILMLAIVLTFLAAVRASSMAAHSKPAEVLRSE